MLYLFGISINFFLILLLSSKKNKILADKFLLIWLVIICAHLLLFVIVTTMPFKKYGELYAIMRLFPLLHGPMLYLYAGAMTSMLPTNKKVWALHFLPFIFVLFVFSPFFLLSTAEKMAVITTGGKGYELEMMISKYTTLFSGVVYVIWLFLILSKHKKNIANQFSFDEKIKLNWLRYYVYGLGAIWGVVIAQTVSSKSYDNYIFGIVVVVVVVTGYFGVKQGRIYDNIIPQFPSADLESNLGNDQLYITESSPYLKVLEETPYNEPEKTHPILLKTKYVKSGLSEASAEEAYNNLRVLMEQEKVYTEPELSLNGLAQKIRIHPNYLSQIINEKEEKNFYDYINALRVQEFKRRIVIPDNNKYTMMSLAADCGFNSKSSFNKNFKKFTGQSPTEYLNKNTKI